MDLIERFRYIMKLNNLTASAFAEKIGVQASSVSHILSGRNKPSLEFIQKVLTNYPKIDASWLINGTTSVSSNSINLDTDQQKEQEQKQELKEEDKKEYGNQRKVDDNAVKGEEKKIRKVLVFYSDGTFEEFSSSTLSA